uniref:Chitinase n=1 Tax=Ganoderma boninense TaxID=34458 RepID=A0A5K1K4L5_9APHY|nr:Chitinase [Ganoderma boninense]
MEPSTPTAAPEQPTAAPSQNSPADATAAATSTCVGTAATNGSPVPPPPAPTIAPIPAAERPWLTFPPFPKPPPDVELIAFKDFKPLGIIIPEPPTAAAQAQAQAQTKEQERGDQEDAPVEVDGLGIQTLTLRVHHDLTTMEKRKRKNVRTKTLPDGTTVLKRWYDEWAEGESLRRTSCPIDPSLPRVDRLYQAAHDFKAGRPTIQNQAVNQMLTQYWDKFRLFVGLISSVQPTAGRKKNAAVRALAAQQAAAAEDDEDDDELDEMPNVSLPKREATINVRTGGVDDAGAPGASANPTSQYSEEERQHRREYFREVRETRIDRFLNDPENVVKVFFSNYASDRGDLSSEKFCNNAPLLIDFFLKFLQRNRVFPDIDRQLRKAIAVTEQAIKELPHGIAMNKIIPDDFGRGCQQLYGNMNGYNIWEGGSSSSEDDEQVEDRASKKQKTDDAPAPSDMAVDQAAASGSSAPAPVALDPRTAAEADALKSALGDELEVITPEAAKGMEKEVEELGPSAHENDWGQVPASTAAEPGLSWGDAPPAAWGAGDDDPFLQASSAADWECGPETNLVNRFLGPTTLALTHTTGVIERSTRRIKSVVLPPAPGTQPQKKKKAGKGVLEPAPSPDPAGIERELDARLAKLTMAPWPAYAVHANADVQKPRVLPDSRGAAVLDDCEGAEVAPGPGVPHNPFKDDIVAYVAPEIADRMWVGMSIEGVWVQLARVDPDVPIVVTDEQFKSLWGNKKKAEGGPGVPIAPTKIWYLEEVRMVLPSFHTEMTPLPTNEDVFGSGERPSPE